MISANNDVTLMNHNEGVAWDRCCGRCPGHKSKGPSNKDFDLVNAVLKRAKGGEIRYSNGATVDPDDDPISRE